ncbi:hypothetical protein HD806DRAFT_473309 [Xylariaceae sp. AK1471]|nr:hypothetical protein HD806DRAFT_473309 [Xylariaceae sp. AK1471]
MKKTQHGPWPFVHKVLSQNHRMTIIACPIITVSFKAAFSREPISVYIHTISISSSPFLQALHHLSSRLLERAHRSIYTYGLSPSPFLSAIMCLQLYPAHASCKHEDGNGTPRPYTFWKCDQKEAGQACQVEYRPWFSANRGAQALCSRCGKAMKELKNSIGIGEDWDRSSSCQLFRVIGWKKNTYQYVWLSTAVVAMVDKQMNSVWWKGRDHKFQERIINLTSFFNSFKTWLLYKMDKVKNKEVLPFTVKWMSRPALSFLRIFPVLRLLNVS